MSISLILSRLSSDVKWRQDMSFSIIRWQLMSSYDVSLKAETHQWMFLLVIFKHFMNVTDVIRYHLMSLYAIRWHWQYINVIWGHPCHTPDFIWHILAKSVKVGGYYNFQTFWRLTHLLTYLHLWFLEGFVAPKNIACI